MGGPGPGLDQKICPFIRAGPGPAKRAGIHAQARPYLPTGGPVGKPVLRIQTQQNQTNFESKPKTEFRFKFNPISIETTSNSIKT